MNACADALLPAIGGGEISGLLFTNLRMRSLVGLGAVLGKVLGQLQPSALLALAKLRSDIARSFFRGAPFAEAMARPAAEAVNGAGASHGGLPRRVRTARRRVEGGYLTSACQFPRYGDSMRSGRASMA